MDARPSGAEGYRWLCRAAVEAAPKDAAAIEAPPAGAAAAEPEEVDMQNGSWAKEEEQAADDVSAKFKPGIKFKLAS